MKRYLLFFMIMSAAGMARAQQFELTSPGRKVTVFVKTSGTLSYSLVCNNKTVVLDSPLGFEFANEPAMGTGLEVTDKKTQNIHETWQPVVPTKHSRVRNDCNELRLSLKETTGWRRRMDICFRAFDDGIAFRYTLYRSAVIGGRKITKELTTFRLPGNPKVWVADYGKYTSSQESEFRPLQLHDITSKTIAGLPFLAEIDSTMYAAITEAGIDNYPGFYIGAATNAGDTVLTTKLSPLPGESEDGVKAQFADLLHTPWRVIMLAGSPGRLIESDLVQNLNAPCALKDISWIKPGMSAWDHWWSGDVKMDMPAI
ncbi:MAG TPA: glycoside hydrolase family 97 N-terminal domain-containing protein, partial [Chitinophagaceae bacterium]|nr:glycoside hydrolase family 97 N-terminal domain-containing protein [Chitinophagaceae bacterium]